MATASLLLGTTPESQLAAVFHAAVVMVGSGGGSTEGPGAIQMAVWARPAADSEIIKVQEQSNARGCFMGLYP
jgi:hypothetical protein